MSDEGLQHVPAAFQRPRPVPAAIPMPERPFNARTLEPSDSTRRRWARLAQADTATREAAHADGVLVAGLCWGLWLVVHVPGAVPTAGARVL